MSTVAISSVGFSPRRRARLARTLFALSALAMVIAGMLYAPTAEATSVGSSAKVAFNYVSVMPGDTLWELAQTYADGKNPQDWIAEVILLNNLQGSDLVAGDKLALP